MRAMQHLTATTDTAAFLRVKPDKMRALFELYSLEAYMDNIEQRVKKIVAEQLGVAEADIKNESSFVERSGR